MREDYWRLRAAGRVRTLAAVLLALCALPATAASAGTTDRAGCHPEWPVVLYHQGGAAVKPPAGAAAPVACVSETGYATSEPTLAVTRSGAVFYSPANSENSLARSFDGGASWTLVEPPRMQHTGLWNTVDPQVVADLRTGRLFWAHTTYTDEVEVPAGTDGTPLGWLAPTAIANAHGFQVFSSPDDGRTWTTADSRHELSADWEKLFLGPPPPASSDAAQPVGYPDVVYLCANAPLEVSGPGRACYRSLDGGATFHPRGYVYPSASAPPGWCPALAANTGVVASDGTTYQPQSCTSGTYLAVSRDEGASYSWLQVPGAPAASGLGAVVQLAIDAADNLYVLWQANGGLFLAISTDGGRSWRAPLSVAAPGLHNLTLPALAAGAPGEVGVAYYASADPSSKELSGYVSETRDALVERPLFYGAAVNEPGHPIFRNYGDTVTPRADFIGATYDSSGTLWAGLVKQLGPPDADSRLPTAGYVARLSFDQGVSR